ncbi:MAG: alanine transaminase [Candidatus Latescibacterota bacterium]|nr:MAG: alanine transaminase [Candidatus Latescibacterota bacterium]RKY72412.1 MAG: alanine transaminase [Candidatus Latescibacterota bacterium]HDN67767.1 aminotransferase class I/II-fold pyridoxal phosphate-dependent enzyme [Bacillota bacterium]
MIYSKRLDRLPPYLFGMLNELKLRLRQQGEDVIDLAMGNPDSPPAPHIVEKLRQVALDPKAHRYSASKGIRNLRKAICRHYQRRYGVELDWETEAIGVIGSKEGLAHLSLALLDEGDTALVPNPTYPIHIYSVVIAGGNVITIPLCQEENFVPQMDQISRKLWPKPKVMILNFPHNPTTAVVDLSFLEQIVEFARQEDILVVHDFAYSDIVFDDYKAPSIMQVKGAKQVAVEFFTMSKAYSMAGWRVGFCVGNSHIIEALAKIKGYYDYGMFTPVQVAAIAALDGPQDCVKETVHRYQRRRDVLVEGLNRIGWPLSKPKATMFVWAPIPDKYRQMGSMKFATKLLEDAKVAVTPGIGFGDRGEGYVRMALVENEHRIRQAIRNIKRCLFR